MRNIVTYILVAISFFCAATSYAQHDKLAGVFSVTACPAENCENSMNFSWAADTSVKSAVVEIAKLSDNEWKSVGSYTFDGKLCTTFDSVYSKGPKGENFYENVVINKFNATVGGLKNDTRYKYRIYPVSGGKKGRYHTSVRYFQTAGAKEWEACIISDFHVYSPLYARTEAAMDMIGEVEKFSANGNSSDSDFKRDGNGAFDWILHLGDITAWGGSYSFWKNLYNERPFKNYMWAGVNGNHDNMTRGYARTTNEFFRDAAAYPHNGYKGEMGVCYHFKYGNVLFIMLNNESMKSDEGLEEAQRWVRKVVAENPSPYTVVCEHYQWFYGESGKESQYSRWSRLFDELGINLALAGNNHIYVSTPALYDGKPVGGTLPVDEPVGGTLPVDEPVGGASMRGESVGGGSFGVESVGGSSFGGESIGAKPKDGTHKDRGLTGRGTVYIQTPSSDNERGVAFDASVPLQYSADKIKYRWSEGSNTVGAMHMKVTPSKMTLTLLDRYGNVLDVTEVLPSDIKE